MRTGARVRAWWLFPRVVRTVVAIIFVVSFALPVGAQPTDARVVAIGDIHGAGDQLVALLEETGIVDRTGQWSAGSDTLVQTGDFMDRGSQVRRVMDLLMRLESDAKASGGQVVVLLGNHETMNLTATVRDVTAEIFLAFADDDSEERQREAYRAYVEYVEHRQATLGRPLPDLQTRSAWLAAHPPGLVEYMDAIGPDGRYGRWLRQKPIAAVIDDTLFLHGGVSPDSEVTDVDEFNDQAEDEIRRFDEIRERLIDRDIILPFSTFEEIGTAVALELDAWIERVAPGPLPPGRRPRRLTRSERAEVDMLLEVQGMSDWSIIASDGPLWYRGFARWSEAEGEQVLPRILEEFGVARVVGGHNVTSTRRIVQRFGGRLFQIDTGMLTGTYRGQASALELVGGEANTVYVAAP